MSRDRLEDLGRLAVMIDQCLNHPIFQDERVLAPDYQQWFDAQPREIQKQLLDQMVGGVEEIEAKLVQALEIAKGVDPLNG